MKGFFEELAKGDLKVYIKVYPSSGFLKFGNITTENELKVYLKAPPEDNKANSELIKFFSKTFKKPKSDFILDKGDKSKRKQIIILNYSADSFVNILKEFIF